MFTNMSLVNFKLAMFTLWTCMFQNSLEEVKYIDGVSSEEDSDLEGEDEGDHDAKNGEDGKDKDNSDSTEEIVDTFRVIGLRRKKGEALVSFLIEIH